MSLDLYNDALSKLSERTATVEDYRYAVTWLTMHTEKFRDPDTGLRSLGIWWSLCPASKQQTQENASR